MAGPSYVLGRFYTAGLPPSGASVRLPCSVTAAPRRPACTVPLPSLVLNSDQDLTIAMMATMMMMILLE